jgi:hypothetical protein
MKLHEEVWSVQEPGRAGQVEGVHPAAGWFRVAWYDGAPSIEFDAEEHVTWERVES